MHIPDGILPLSVSLAGYGLAAAGTAYALRKIGQQDDPRAGVPKAALFTAAFFVASLIHIPIPPTSVHLILGGLMGVMLGYYAMPAILIGLFFQATMFQHGGITTLGINACLVGIPALASHFLFQLRHRPSWRKNKTLLGVLGFLGGSVGVLLTTVMATFLLLTMLPAHLNNEVIRAGVYVMALSHLPLALIEGAITAMVVTFLLRVKPSLLDNP
ncbi:cobalt transporter CbiM [Heliorestis convoluta]|uniref:Cobalamin (Vitamin B12) biosynthesis CbiM protein n=1 Tax=Heliorestis convoluta TaxID=356322 RepID=A0A5Q2MXZ7_9FIRM|nr:cobalt transporter CbiM [Heliorestis convoluta]QGG46243.1 Cobalamin (Vitamin B12) biosynthesis CbiM protein [Heliorestis convoluta]